MNPPHTPIEEGIRAVAVGKSGSKDCPAELVDRILVDLDEDRVDPVQKAAFFAALAMKGTALQEEPLPGHP